MKVRADEHISRRIVRAVRSIALDPGWELSTVKERGHAGTPDEHWIAEFGREGGNAILSADRDFFRLAPQIGAVAKTGMKVIHLPAKWANAKIHLQAAHILMWWPRIETTIAEMAPRECYQPEWTVRETGLMKKVRIDFGRARRKRR